ncbi:hypothetical protein H0H93_005338, partial [Arthromyces matolae]
MYDASGDSYTQTGFDPTDTLPSVGNPLGNPGYPGDTATGGPNWLDIVTTRYNNSLIFTYDYAYGGATINATLVPPTYSYILTLADQVDEFLKGAGTKPATTPWTSDNALFSIWIGINDIGNNYSSNYDYPTQTDSLLTAYFALVQKLVRQLVRFFFSTPTQVPQIDRGLNENANSAIGARNFLFVNVPPVNRTPMMTAQGPCARYYEANFIQTFNSQLLTFVASFEQTNPGVSTYFWDSNALFTAILNDPIAYGFVDNVSIGSDPDDFWGNNYHPS